jgi:tetratricopeptide (TPR) repeat protein
MIDRLTRLDAAEYGDEQLLEKLQGFGLEGGRVELERLCEGALSVEEVAGPLVDRRGARDGRPHEDWVWLCLLELWGRWWPERVCVEFLGDKIQAGYDALERHDAVSAAATWLDAWSDVVRLCDLSGIDSIREFDDRFSMYQSLFNWSGDLEDALWNAGREDPELLRARIAVCEQALRRFSDEDVLMVENRRRAVAESYFELGETDKAEGLFEQWLAGDPGWGWGWIGWADLHFFANHRPKDHGRAEELLRRGFATPGVRDRDDIADRLVLLYRETGRGKEAQALAPETTRSSRSSSGMSVRRAIDLEDAGQRTVVRDTTTAGLEGEGYALDRMMEIVEALDDARPSVPPRRAAKVQRNAPCPCGSGRKYKKCCGNSA